MMIYNDLHILIKDIFIFEIKFKLNQISNQFFKNRKPSIAVFYFILYIMSEADNLPTQPEDLANFMDSIFSQMEQKFTDMAQQVLSRIDEMSSKINELETSIDQLMNQADGDPK